MTENTKSRSPIKVAKMLRGRAAHVKIMPPIGLFAITLSPPQPCTEQTITQPKSITSLAPAALTIALPLQPFLRHRVGGLSSPSLFVPIETWKCARRSKALASRIGLPVLGGRFWLIRLIWSCCSVGLAFFFAWLNMLGFCDCVVFLYLEMMYCFAYSGLSLVCSRLTYICCALIWSWCIGMKGTCCHVRVFGLYFALQSNTWRSFVVKKI